MPTNHKLFHCIFHGSQAISHFKVEKGKKSPKRVPDYLRKKVRNILKKKHKLKENEENFFCCQKELSSLIRRNRIKKDVKSFSEKTEKTQSKELSQFVQKIKKLCGDEEGIEVFCKKLANTTFGKKHLQHYSETQTYGMSQNEVKVFVKNVKTLFGCFKTKSHLRSPLLNFLTKDMISTKMAEFFDVSLSEIKKSKRMTQDQLNKTLLFKERFCQKYCEQFSQNELDDFQSFLQIYCNPPSGTDNDMFFSQQTVEGLFEEYSNWRNELNQTRIEQRTEEETERIIAAMENKERTVPALFNLFPVRCFKSFNKIRKHFHIRFYKKNWKWCQCPICSTKSDEIDSKIREMQEIQNQRTFTIAELRKWFDLKKKRRHYDLHKNLIKFHRKIKKKLMDEMDQTALMISFDFVAFNFPISKGQFYTINDFVIVLETKNEKNEIQREYLDFICDKSVTTNDTKFVQTAFNYLYSQGFFRKYCFFYIFSHNGGKHFKNRMTLKYFTELAKATGKSFNWIFYASHHGFSMCDAHGGLLSSILDKAQKDDLKIYKTTKEFISATKQMTKTKFIEITEVNSSISHEAEKIPGLTYFHHFTFGPGTLIMKECYHNQLPGCVLDQTVNYENFQRDL